MAKRKGDEQGRLAAKVQKRSPFQCSTEYEDSVTLRFDDKRELYASATFLRGISPVFDVMLSSDFKERSTGVVELKQKILEDFLAFLHLCHHTEYEPVTESNVLQVAPLAEEYQVPLAVEVCKVMLLSMLQRFNSKDYIQKREYNNGRNLQSDDLTLLLNIFRTVSMCSYTSMMPQTCEILADFPCCFYINKKNCAHRHDHLPLCSIVFETLSYNAKAMLLEARLSKPCNK